MKICSDSLGGFLDNRDFQDLLQEEQMERVSKFCIYLLDKLYMENNFSWEDTKVCFYPKFQASLFL